jgi:hypothetical protein
MMKIAGHWVNPAHISAVHVIERKGWSQRNWNKWHVEIQMASGYSFLDWGNGTDSLRNAEEIRNSLAQLINRELGLKD